MHGVCNVIMSVGSATINAYRSMHPFRAIMPIILIMPELIACSMANLNAAIVLKLISA